MGLANLGMMNQPDKAYAWLEKIENGTLVHYQVPVKHRMKSPGIGMPFPVEDFEPTEDKAKVMEYCTLGQKTIYCQDLEAVFTVLKKAEAAQEEIARLERDGKMGGEAFMATS